MLDPTLTLLIASTHNRSVTMRQKTVIVSVLFFCLVMATYITCFEPKDGDFKYYVAGCSIFPLDHPLTFFLLHIINLFTGSAVASVICLQILSFGFLYFMIFLVTKTLTESCIFAFVSCVFPMSFVFTFSGTPLKSVVGLGFFFLSINFLLKYDKVKTHKNLLLFFLSALLTVLSHIVTSFLLIAIFSMYLLKRDKRYLLPFGILTSIVYMASLFIPYFESNLKVFILFKYSGLESIFVNISAVFFVPIYFMLYVCFVTVVLVFWRYREKGFVSLALLLCSGFLLHFGFNADWRYRFFMIVPFVLAPLIGIMCARIDRGKNNVK